MSTVLIGDAAALYGLAPSTLRWWERQGLLSTPDRGNGRRHYGADDLRRIGLAYLCCVTGMMPLDKAAVVTAGRADFQTWQQTIRDQMTDLDQRMQHLQSARDYLEHLLSCTHDDVIQCDHLDHELTEHTPRGRVAEPDIVTAARLASRSDTGASTGPRRVPPAAARRSGPAAGR